MAYIQHLSGFISLIIICGSVLYLCSKARHGVKYEIRRVAGIDVIDEAIGRATEMGRPVHLTTGLAKLYEATAPQTLAGLSILSYVARKCARNGTPLITTINVAEIIPLVAEIYKNASIIENIPDWFKENENNIRYLSSHRFSYATGVQGVLQRERPGASFLFGRFMAEALIFAESGNIAGAMQVAGTASTTQTPFFVAACDYALLGDELYAAGAYLSEDPIQIASIAAQDIGKYWAIILLILGGILSAVGIPWIVTFLKM